MSLLVLDNISLAYGHHALLDRASLSIEPHERICLIGRNGEGKSSLLRIISGEIQPDSGTIKRPDRLRIAGLAQETDSRDPRRVFEVIAAGLPEAGALLAQYHQLLHEMDGSDAKALQRLADLQQALESRDGWTLQMRVETLLSRLDLDGEAIMSELSGGYRRRVLLGQALVAEPDLLLLDEPTNHLDIDGIAWLEEFIASYHGTVLFVTHDRAFLQRVAGRILELDRGRLTSWPGHYADYLRRKEQQLDNEATQAALFDKKLSEEEAWLRQGVKARRTRNEGRVRALKALREERAQRRDRTGNVKLQVDQGSASGKLVAELAKVSFSYGGEKLIEDLSTTVLRGDRIGIIGPNGVGKSTLIRLLLGLEPPDSGAVRLGSNLQVAYFDQQREQLDPEATVIENLNLGTDWVTVNGQSRHVMSYLRDFLFAPERVRSPVKALSGGERNRVLLARLFARPANLLVMDEPTNDLDIETLELLEELLADYPGTLILVSHDRAFLDNVVTGTLVFEGAGRVNEYVGGYNDWLRQRAQPPGASPAPKRSEPAAPASMPPERATKLSYKEQRELDQLPLQIEQLEQELAALQVKMGDPVFYRGAGDAVKQTTGRMQQAEAELNRILARWEELAKKG